MKPLSQFIVARLSLLSHTMSFASLFRMLFLTCLLCLSGVAHAADLPNVVILYSDDAGYADFGFQPNVADDMRSLTPHIDSIAREGARFSDAYMSGCVCSPSRAGLMTGRYQQRFGFDNNLPPGTQDGLDLDETFGAKHLQKLGYTTGLIGKWHLGYPEAFHPNERGFDLFYGLLQGSRPYYEMPKPTPHRVIQQNGKPLPERGYVTDRFGDAACEFITRHKSEPFYLFVSFTSPHGPLQPKPEDLKRLTHITNPKRKKYAGLVVSLDDNVGKILACLKEHDLQNDTLVIFTNDNGGQTQTGANNTPLKGRKGQLSEGGIRVPFAARWPKVINAGRVIDTPIIALDILPTMIEAAGGDVDPQWRLDGQSFLPLLRGVEIKAVPRPLFWRQHGRPGARAMRNAKWKLHHDRKNNRPPALYDLDADIAEEHDLAAEHPDLVQSMLRALDAWESELDAPRWGPNKAESSR